MVCYSFPVGLFHSLLHAGLSRRTLWVLHTYCYQIAAYSPYLNIYSLIEESGKSACLTLLRSLCADPWAASGVSTSVLQRRIIANRPTVLMDNWHTTFRTDKQQITGFLL